jgi:hypothetical protein
LDVRTLNVAYDDSLEHKNTISNQFRCGRNLFTTSNRRRRKKENFYPLLPPIPKYRNYCRSLCNGNASAHKSCQPINIKSVFAVRDVCVCNGVKGKLLCDLLMVISGSIDLVLRCEWMCGVESIRKLTKNFGKTHKTNFRRQFRGEINIFGGIKFMRQLCNLYYNWEIIFFC